MDLLLHHSSAMEAFIAREGEMVLLNAENHTFADEVQRAVVQLQALKDDAYQDAVAPMTLQVQQQDTAKPPVEAEGEMVVLYAGNHTFACLLYTSPSPRDRQKSRMPSSA